jgi:hypothetical protein
MVKVDICWHLEGFAPSFFGNEVIECCCYILLTVIVTSAKKFYILLTVHHVTILGKWPMWCTILFCVFIFIFNSLHVLSTSCSSSGERNCVNTTSGNWHSVLVATSCAGQKTCTRQCDNWYVSCRLCGPCLGESGWNLSLLGSGHITCTKRTNCQVYSW